jgi:hypothetical protein
VFTYIDRLLSTLLRSFENLFKITPVGVRSKYKFIGALKTELQISRNKLFDSLIEKEKNQKTPIAKNTIITTQNKIVRSSNSALFSLNSDV